MDEDKCSFCHRHLPDAWDMDVCGPCLVILRQKEWRLADAYLKTALNEGMRDWKELKAQEKASRGDGVSI